MGRDFQSKHVMVGDIKTHYLEAGEGEALILLHSGEFGASAEFSWEHNIEALSKHFHVYAPDWLGYGQTDKIFSFTDMYQRRLKHIRDFLDLMCIKDAYFIGNSMGGTMLANTASCEQPIFPIKKMIVVSGGGFVPENEARDTLNNYECTKEAMRKILQVLFYDSKWWDDEYLERRYQASIEPGAWECTAAVRLKSPAQTNWERRRNGGDPALIKIPTLIVAGREDLLRLPGYAKELHSQIPGSELKVFDQARHCPHIEHSEKFNELAIQFLKDN